MKTIITIFFILFSFVLLSQKDTNQICFPGNIGKQILLDLNELDRLKDSENLTKKEITNLETKVIKQDSIISKLEQKDVNNIIIIGTWEEKYKLVEDDNKDLRIKLKWSKIKTNIIEIFSGAVITSIIYIQFFK